MIDAVVIGAGVIGLAIARELARRGDRVLVLEQAGAFGQGISSRNSEVIHAGIHGPKGSLKVRAAIEGREALYRYCHQRNIPHRRIGKLIVACDERETRQLHTLATQAEAHGLSGLELLSAAEVRRREPHIRCVQALWVPHSGVVDSHALMLTLLADLESFGGELVTRTRVSRLELRGDRWQVAVAETDDVLLTRQVVNAAGLGAWELARNTVDLDPALIPAAYLGKGHYFAARGPSPFSRLIYPLPSGGGLGIHATLDLAGRVRYGPDLVWVDAVDYAFPAGDALRQRFVRSIARYYPAIRAKNLTPDYAGIRPRLAGPNDAPADFMIQTCKDHGLVGLIHLFGIESPGLTAAFALARHVADDLARDRRRG